MANTHEGDRDRPVLFGDGTPRKVPHDMAVFVLAAAVVGMKRHARFSVGLVFQAAVQPGDDGTTAMALTTVKTYALSFAERLLAETVVANAEETHAQRDLEVERAYLTGMVRKEHLLCEIECVVVCGGNCLIIDRT